MKKYLAPTAKYIVLDSAELLASSGPQLGNGEGSVEESNSRTPSNFIWGDED